MVTMCRETLVVAVVCIGRPGMSLLFLGCRGSCPSTTSTAERGQRITGVG